MAHANTIDSEFDTCSVTAIHPDRIQKVDEGMPEQEHLYGLADLFKLFGDSTRLRILWALSESELCVCDLCVLLRMKQPAVSHQLKNLKLARIVKSRREGKIVFYSLQDEHIRDLLNLGMAHVSE